MLTGWIYMGLMVADIVFMLVQLYFIVNYTDLEHDYISPTTLCETMENYYPMEVYGQSGIVLVAILLREWTTVFVTLPVLLWNVYIYQTRGFKFDATGIFRQLGVLKAEAFGKLAYYMVTFCYLLYCMIWWLVIVYDD